LEAKTWELRLKKVNGTFVDLTLHCVGELKSNPQWKHNEVTVSNGTLNTTLYRDMNQTTRHYTLTMTRRHVTERFAGRYQCVDTAFFQSDSDVLTIHARACSTYPGRLCVTSSQTPRPTVPYITSVNFTLRDVLWAEVPPHHLFYFLAAWCVSNNNNSNNNNNNNNNWLPSLTCTALLYPGAEFFSCKRPANQVFRLRFG